MHVEVESIYSVDLEQASPSGLPADLTHFSEVVWVSLQESGSRGCELFDLVVCSPSALAETEAGRFVLNTLVLDVFSWDAIRERIEKLLMHVRGAESWNEVACRLAGCLRAVDGL